MSHVHAAHTIERKVARHGGGDRFADDYEGTEHLIAAGDCVHQRPGITHYLFDYSPDMEYLEVVAPADFPTIEVAGLCAVPEPPPWPAA